MGDLVIPDRLREVSVQWEGEQARTWLVDLPGIVAALTKAWDLEVDPPFDPGGQISWVAPCMRRGDPTPLVLKVQLPHPESDPEAAALVAWNGKGAVRLHAHDATRSALLLERCEPGAGLVDTDDVAAGFAAATAIAGDLHAAAVPDGVPELAQVLAMWADHLEERRPLLAGVDHGLWSLALAAIREPAGLTGRSVLLHGDLNPTNVLMSGRGWLAIDPKPMVGDPGYDAARVVLQLAPDAGSDPTVVTGRRIRRMAEALGIAAEAVATWCLVDLLETSGFAAATGDPAESQRLLTLIPRIVPTLG